MCIWVLLKSAIMESGKGHPCSCLVLCKDKYATVHVYMCSHMYVYIYIYILCVCGFAGGWCVPRCAKMQIITTWGVGNATAESESSSLAPYVTCFERSWPNPLRVQLLAAPTQPGATVNPSINHSSNHLHLVHKRHPFWDQTQWMLSGTAGKE